MHYRIELNDHDTGQIMADWAGALHPYSSSALSAAVEVWLLNEQWMPTLSGMLDVVQGEARRERREREAARALPAGPRNDEPIASAAEWMSAIRTGLERRGIVVRGDVTDIGHGPVEARGHDHRNGASGCPVCSRHDHSHANWRQTCPACGIEDDTDLSFWREDRPAGHSGPMWSPCRECDGSHFVFTDANTVRPCQSCNPVAYRLWREGHFAPGHRCEECAPTTRRRRGGDDE